MKKPQEKYVFYLPEVDEDEIRCGNQGRIGPVDPKWPSIQGWDVELWCSGQGRVRLFLCGGGHDDAGEWQIEDWVLSFRLADIRESRWKAIEFENEIALVRLAFDSSQVSETPTREELEQVAPYRGKVKVGARSRRALLVEQVDDALMGGGSFSGEYGEFEGLVHRVADVMGSTGVSPESPEGQEVLSDFLEHALGEMYGDFLRFAQCTACGKEFKPTYDLEYVREVLARREMCEECKRQSE